MDKDIRKSILKEVRKSVVRISFSWQPERKGYEVMVIAGVVASINNDGLATIIADPVFFRQLEGQECYVRFPKEGGYETELTIPCSYVVPGDNFCTFKLKPKEHGYIKPVTFESTDPEGSEIVYTFVFARESSHTSVEFSKGRIIDSTQARVKDAKILSHDCSMHEYGYLGSPVFNMSGYLIGISHLDRCYIQAWSVHRIEDEVLSKLDGISWSPNDRTIKYPGTSCAPAEDEDKNKKKKDDPSE